MVRIHWTVDLLEAEILADFLRDHEIAADVFDRHLVRQNWFYTLTFGGYRVMAPREQAADAVALLRRRRDGEFALSATDGITLDEVPCPACGSLDTSENPVPRNIALASAMLIALPLPWLVRWHFRCSDCPHRWRARPQRSFAQLAQQAAAALEAKP